MNENVIRYLNKFYSALYDNLERDRKLKNDSIIISFIETTKNTIHKAMSASSKSSSKIPTDVLNSLLSEGLIQSTDEIDTYAITAKGVWLIENEKGVLNEEILISYINKEYFVGDGVKPISEKEKVVLFSMIAARTFSENSSVDLNKDNRTPDVWKDTLDAACEKLFSLGIVSQKTRDDLYNKSGNEHVVSGLFRRNNDLPRKVKGLYKFTGEKKYFLDLYDGSQISQEKLSYLFWQIFNGNISKESLEDISNFCNEISNNKSIYIFTIKNHPFSMPKYDLIIKDCLVESIISKRKWERVP